MMYYLQQPPPPRTVPCTPPPLPLPPPLPHRPIISHHDEALTYKELSEADVCSIFNDFVDSRYVSRKRPFYFHNDEVRLRNMFAALEEHGVKASILPDV
jgi:hypothetical protein